VSTITGQIAALKWYAANQTGVAYGSLPHPIALASDGEHIYIAHYLTDEPGSSYQRDVSKRRGSDGATLLDFTRNTVVVPPFEPHSPLCIMFDGISIWVGSKTELWQWSAYEPAFQNSLFTSNVKALAFDGTHVWAVDSVANVVHKIQGYPLPAIIATYPVGPNPSGLAFDGTHIWVANHGSSDLTKIRAYDGKYFGRFKIHSSPKASHPVALAFDGLSLWVANSISNTVANVSVSDGGVLGLYPSGGDDPSALVFDGKNIWVANRQSNNVALISRGDGSLLGTFNVGKGPTSLAFDGANVWVANYVDETVTRL
jgi:DNA-binding beta-propeller fold protein YncE